MTGLKGNPVKQKFALILALLIILVLIGILIVPDSENEDDDLTDIDGEYEQTEEVNIEYDEPTEVPEEAGSVQKYTKYKNDQYGYTIEYPESWILTDGMEKPDSKASAIFIQATEIFDPPAFSVSNQITKKAECEKLYDASNSAGLVSFEKSDETINGISYKTSTLVIDDPSMNARYISKSYQYWDKENQQCYKITRMDTLDGKYKSILEHILQSLVIN